MINSISLLVITTDCVPFYVIAVHFYSPRIAYKFLLEPQRSVPEQSKSERQPSTARNRGRWLTVRKNTNSGKILSDSQLLEQLFSSSDAKFHQALVIVYLNVLKNPNGNRKDKGLNAALLNLTTCDHMFDGMNEIACSTRYFTQWLEQRKWCLAHSNSLKYLLLQMTASEHSLFCEWKKSSVLP